MDQNELFRLRGEQVTLQAEQRDVAGQIEAERSALQTRVNALRPVRGLKAGWLDAELGRVRRLHELAERFLELEARIDELRKVSGI